MTDDLVKRLRAGCVTGNYEGLEFIEWAKSNATMNESADRIEQLEIEKNRSYRNLTHAMKHIEKLEAALRSIAANACCDSCREAALVARKALEGKDEA